MQNHAQSNILHASPSASSARTHDARALNRLAFTLPALLLAVPSLLANFVDLLAGPLALLFPIP